MKKQTWTHLQRTAKHSTTVLPFNQRVKGRPGQDSPWWENVPVRGVASCGVVKPRSGLRGGVLEVISSSVLLLQGVETTTTTTTITRWLEMVLLRFARMMSEIFQDTWLVPRVYDMSTRVDTTYCCSNYDTKTPVIILNHRETDWGYIFQWLAGLGGGGWSP